MDLNERLFIIVPLISLLCNAFLFVAVLSAKKNRLVYAFIAMLGGFTIWCSGSLFMRMMLAPGPDFWYQVSIAGIFLVPVLLYNFIYCFVEVRGQFIRIALFIIWTPLILMNLFNVFITDPHMVVENGERRFVTAYRPGLWSLSCWPWRHSGARGGFPCGLSGKGGSRCRASGR